MTGRELIVYILQNHLENEIVFDDGFFVGLINEEQAAVKLGVGISTIKLWYDLGYLKGFKIKGSIYFLMDIEDPRKKNSEGR